MSYKFQLGPARLSGSLVQEGDVDLAGGMKISGSLVLGADRAMQNLASVSASAGVSGFTGTFEGGLTVGDSQVIDEDRQLKNIASLDATSEATIEGAIDTLANLASMGSNGSELEALGSLDIAQGLKIANTSVISSARAVSNVTSIDGSGDLTMGTITMTGFTVDADGDTVVKTVSGSGGLSGLSLTIGGAGNRGFDEDGQVSVNQVNVNSGGIVNAGSIAGATTISGSGALQAFSATFEGGLTVGGSQIIDEDKGLKNIASLDATTEATIEGAIDTLANLASMGADGDELEALGSLDVAQGLKIANTSVISQARAVANITTLSGSGRAQAFDVVAEGGFLVGGNKVIDEDRKLTVLSSSVSTFYGSGNAQFASGVRVEGAALFDGAVTLGNATGDDLTLTGRVASAIVPKADSTHNLGSDSLRWDTIYVDNIVGANIVKDVEARAGGQTISAGTEFALITAGDGVTVTLPAASAGKCLHVKLSSSIGDVILEAAAGDLVEAQASIRLESTGSAVNLVAYDAMTWFIV
jgi:hypothetical protein